jgi:hypothetical protein
MVEETRELSLEETLRELAKELPPRGRRLSLSEYFEMLEWADLYTCLPHDGSWTRGAGMRENGAQYGMLFTESESAAAFGAPEFIPVRVRAREVLQRIPDGWGVIIDYRTPAEVRISPDELTEQNERIRIKPVSQEADDAWLARVNESLARNGMPRHERAARAKELWAERNGFRVLPGSRRARRIDWYFDVVADASAEEARRRCDTRWRREYEADPYLHHLTVEELEARGAAIRTNSMFADREALPHELDEREWLELDAHLCYEYERRALPRGAGSVIAARLAAWPRIDVARDAFRRYSGPTGQLFKFGERKYLEPMLRDGHIRIFPAAKYLDASLTAAQQDDELTRRLLLDATNAQVLHTGADGVQRPLQAIGTFEVTASAGTNFYVWCVTTTPDPRLFDDFGADACLVIHDGHTFIEGLLAAMQVARPDFVPGHKLVHYYDPVRGWDAVLSPREKDFRYAYQREYRFLWDPPFPRVESLALAPVDLRLGSLEDVASLVTL